MLAKVTECARAARLVLTQHKKQGQIFEIQSRIQHLLVPMAHSQSVYMSNMIKNYEAAAGPRSAAPENTPIKVLQSVAVYVALYVAVFFPVSFPVFFVTSPVRPLPKIPHQGVAVCGSVLQVLQSMLQVLAVQVCLCVCACVYV